MLQGLEERAPGNSWLSWEVVEMLLASGVMLSHMTLIFPTLGPEICGLGRQLRDSWARIPFPQLWASADAAPAVPAGREALPLPMELCWKVLRAASLQPFPGLPALFWVTKPTTSVPLPPKPPQS